MPKQMPEPIPGVCFPSSREDKTCLLAYEQNDCRLLKHQLKFHFLKFLNPWNNTCLPPPHAPLEHFLNIWAYMALFSCVFYDTVWVSDQPGSDTNFNSQSLLGGLIHVSAGVYQQLRAWILAKPLLCASQLTQWRPRVLIDLKMDSKKSQNRFFFTLSIVKMEHFKMYPAFDKTQHLLMIKILSK